MSDAFARLAATGDPSVLVRGDVASVEGFADRLAAFANLLLDAGDSMARADAGWRGKAGASFWERLTAAASAFRTAGDAMGQASVAVREYARELTEARDLAARAAGRWDEGMRAVAAARDGSVGFDGFPGSHGLPPDLWLRWETAGSGERAEAVAWLELAWDQQDAAALKAAACLTRATTGAPEAASWWETLAPTVLGVGSMGDSRQKRELAAGSGRGLVDLALAGGTNQWGTTDLVNRSLDRWERDHGLNPRSGIHQTARFVSPMAVPLPGLGQIGIGEGLVGRVLVRSRLVVPDGGFAHVDIKVLRLAGRSEARAGLVGELATVSNRFFRGATAKSEQFEIVELSNGGYRMQFFSPARNPGYGTLYVQEIDETGSVVREYKKTIGPEGLIEIKWVHGES